MPAPIRAIEPRHLTLRCVSCGLAMPDLDADHCPRCGTDLEERPPRSYAEMEGLLDHAERPVVLHRAGWQERRIVERWLAVAFIGALIGIGALALILAVSRG